MRNFNKQNFFDKLKEKYPKAIEIFCLWIDRYKERTNWNELFGGGVVAAPKFHDLPYEMQYGIMLFFFKEMKKLALIDRNTAEKLIEDLFQCLENETDYFDTSQSLGAVMISMERRQHFSKHNQTIDDDKANSENEMSDVAAAILLGEERGKFFYPSWWKPEFWEKTMAKPRTEQIVIAGSFAAAQIDLLLEEQKLQDNGGSGNITEDSNGDKKQETQPNG